MRSSPPPTMRWNSLVLQRNLAVATAFVLMLYFVALKPNGQQVATQYVRRVCTPEEVTTSPKDVQLEAPQPPAISRHSLKMEGEARLQTDGSVFPIVDDSILQKDHQRFPKTPSLPAHYGGARVELQGQVTLSTTFGSALNRLAKQPDVKLVLEIGTWYGGGSSWCIANGLRDTITNPSHPDKWLFTMEMFQPAHDYAAQTLRDLPVTCILGGTVGKDGYLQPHEIPEEEKTEHYRLYYDRDIKLADTAKPLLAPICSAYDFDVVLLDGNEYTGWAEFEVVRQVCKPRYIALHDCNTLKTRKVQDWLREADGQAAYELVAQGQDAAAWAIYKAKQPTH